MLFSKTRFSPQWVISRSCNKTNSYNCCDFFSCSRYMCTKMTHPKISCRCIPCKQCSQSIKPNRTIPQNSSIKSINWFQFTQSLYSLTIDKINQSHQAIQQTDQSIIQAIRPNQSTKSANQTNQSNQWPSRRSINQVSQWINQAGEINQSNQ